MDRNLMTLSLAEFETERKMEDLSYRSLHQESPLINTSVADSAIQESASLILCACTDGLKDHLYNHSGAFLSCA